MQIHARRLSLGRLSKPLAESLQAGYYGDVPAPAVDLNEWIEVRLADFDAPSAHARRSRGESGAERVALRREITCTAERGRGGRVRSFDRASLRDVGSAGKSLMICFARLAC